MKEKQETDDPESIHGSHTSEDEAGCENEENERDGPFDDNARNAIHDIREDLGRQLGLASNKQNSMVTIIVILLAFASLMFISTYPDDGLLNSPLSGGSLSAIVFGLCCTVGIMTMLLWRDHDQASDEYISQAIDHFNKEKLFDVQTELFYGLRVSHNATREKNAILGKVIKMMVFIIAIGITVTMIGSG